MVGRERRLMPVILEPPFTRVLNGEPIPEVGIDVEGIGRALCRAKIGYVPLDVFTKMPASWRRTYGSRKRAAVNVIRRREGRRQNGIYDAGVHGVLIDMGAFDARATNMMLQYEPPLALCYPIAKGFNSWVCQGPHETGGIPGNWAYDFCVPEITGNGSPVLAVQDAWVYRLSGKDPNHDVPDPTGAFGWSVYLQTRSWVIYYVTHLGRRVVNVGQKLRAGDIIGYVGDQVYRPDHVHYGCTHPMGEARAREQMRKVSLAPRVSIGL
jgi:hypothetical protein